MKAVVYYQFNFLINSRMRNVISWWIYYILVLYIIIYVRSWVSFGVADDN